MKKKKPVVTIIPKYHSEEEEWWDKSYQIEGTLYLILFGLILLTVVGEMIFG